MYWLASLNKKKILESHFNRFNDNPIFCRIGYKPAVNNPQIEAWRVLIFFRVTGIYYEISSRTVYPREEI